MGRFDRPQKKIPSQNSVVGAKPPTQAPKLNLKLRCLDHFKLKETNYPLVKPRPVGWIWSAGVSNLTKHWFKVLVKTDVSPTVNNKLTVISVNASKCAGLSLKVSMYPVHFI